MIPALLSTPDSLVLAAIVTGLSGIVVAAYGARQARSAKKELRPNGGSSALDAINRRFDTIEADGKATRGLVEHIYSELSSEKAARQTAEALISERVDRLEKP